MRLPPLVLGGDDVLVDDDLRAVDEVAELRLPQHQRFAVGVCIPVLEPTAAYSLSRLSYTQKCAGGTGQRVERNPAVLVLVVDQGRMALAERAATAVFAEQDVPA